MTNRYLDGERPAPRAAGDSPLADAWAETARLVRGAARGLPAPRRARRPLGVRRRGQQAGRRRAAVGPRQGVRRRATRPPATASATSSATSSRRAGSSASPSPRSCRGPRRGCSPSSATPTRTGRMATAARRSSTSSRGAPTPAEPGRVTAPEPLFPRLDVEADRRTDARPVRLVDSHCHLNADRFEGDVDLVLGGARLAGVERILVPGWNVASSERALALVERFPWLDAAVGRPSARRGQGGRRRLGDHRRPGVGRPGGRHRRDRARLRPRVQPDPGPADEPAPQPRARARDRQARDPALPLRRRTPRRAGRPPVGAGPGRRGGFALGRRRSAIARRPSSTRTPARSTTVGPSSTWGSPSASRASSSVAARRRRPRSPGSCRTTGSSSRPTRRSWHHPAHHARATNPSGSASQQGGSRDAAMPRSTRSATRWSRPTTGRSVGIGAHHDPPLAPLHPRDVPRHRRPGGERLWPRQRQHEPERVHRRGVRHAHRHGVGDRDADADRQAHGQAHGHTDREADAQAARPVPSRPRPGRSRPTGS